MSHPEPLQTPVRRSALRRKAARATVSLHLPETEHQTLKTLVCLVGAVLLLRCTHCEGRWWACAIEGASAGFALSILLIVGATALMSTLRKFKTEWKRFWRGMPRKRHSRIEPKEPHDETCS
jgi:hypothetical protein